MSWKVHHPRYDFTLEKDNKSKEPDPEPALGIPRCLTREAINI
jgi:hypothetical protein